MQDKEVVFGSSEENASSIGDGNEKKGDSLPKKERRDSNDEKKPQHGNSKDGKFQFRRMKAPKKEKTDKKSASRFKGEGVSFKAKLIGVDEVPDPRGDKMCQDSMHRLKLSVKTLGPHKRKIIISVSLQGIKIKDEKSSALLYHHPVALISFISQDISDARAFGYVAGSSEGQHEFIAIKTEKPAFHVVVALRDLFQTVLNWKQEEMDQVKKMDEQDGASSAGSDSLHEKTSVTDNVTDSVSEEEKSTKEENIYFDVILTEPFKMIESDAAAIDEIQDAPKTVDDLLGLQDELNKLQQGIAQMDTSIAAATYTLGTSITEKDPFDTSFVNPSGPKIDAFTPHMPTPVQVSTPVLAIPQFQDSFEPTYEDKYAALNALDYQPSIFTSEPQPEAFQAENAVPDLQDLEEEIKKKSTAPAKPPRHSKTATVADPLVFADLDPLGKDRPYKDKTEFFQDVKNPPKKVLNDLVSNGNMNGDDRLNVGSPPFVMSSSPISNGISSSSLPNSSFLSNLKFSMGYPTNGNTSPFNPFEHEITSNNISPPNGISDNTTGSLSSSPIPIPNRNRPITESKDRSMSNSSLGSPSSRSPIPIESPSVLMQNGYGTSPLTNGFHQNPANSQSGKIHNGVSRPRPRPSSVSKGSSAPSSSHLTTTESEIVISRENMQSIANMLRVNGHRTRAGSFPVVETSRNFRIPVTTVEDIFTKKSDPFDDGFFCSLPKKVPNHLTKTQITDCV